MTNLHNLSLQFGLFYKHNSLPFGRIRAGRRLLLKRAQKGTEIFRPVNHGRKITKSSIGDAKKIAWTRKKEAGKGQKGFLRLFWHKFLYLLTSRIFQPQFNFHLKVYSFHFVSFQSLRRLRQAGAKFCKTLSEVSIFKNDIDIMLWQFPNLKIIVCKVKEQKGTIFFFAIIISFIFCWTTSRF